MGRRHWQTAGMACMAAMLLAAVPASAQEVRIISVDGQLVRDGRAGPVKVLPGQVVSLTADEVYQDRGQQEYAYRPIEDFSWRADDVPDDVCDPEQDCRAVSNFETTDYGVNYYVPRNAPRRIEIVVTSKYDAGEDRILLINEAREQAVREGYDYGLTRYGWWTTVSGERVFVPYSYEDDWEPYTHGYWYWTSFGWTWYSYDPWGDVTDHYGHWRHHGSYGWVWLPDPAWAWRAAVVSFFYGNGWVGWWPYDGGWSHGYRQGYAQGYDDGYWMGYWAGRRVGDYPGRHVRPGATVVAYGDFYVPGEHRRPPDRADRGGERGHADRGGDRAYDISTRRISDKMLVERNFTESVRQGAVGAILGGGSSLAASRQFIAQKAGVTAPETVLKPTRSSVGASQRAGFAPVKPEHQAPDSYRAVSERVRTTLGATPGAGMKGVRAPLGQGIERASVDRTSLRPERGVAPAPVFRGADRAQVQTWAPRTPDAGGVRPAPGDANVRDSVRTGTARPDTVRPGAVQPGTVRPDVVRPTNPVRPAPEGAVQQAEPDRTLFERRPPTVENRVAPQQRETVSPTWQRPATEPPTRTVQPQQFERPQGTQQQYERPQAAPQQQQWRPQATPQEARPRTEFQAPPQEVRREVPREVPREVYRPQNVDRAVRPSAGGGSPSGGSSAPPAYVPPKPRAAPAPSMAPAPSRGRPAEKRER